MNRDYVLKRLDELMKITIEKTAQITIDTSVERKRINKAFKDDKITRQKLHELMDLIENEQWEKAGQELEGSWWQGRDEKLECPRLEFVGMIHSDSPFFSSWITYEDLIANFYNYPKNYKVILKELDIS